MKVAIFTDTYLPEINGVANTLGKLKAYFDDNRIEYKFFAPQYQDTKDEKGVIRLSSLRFLPNPESRVSFPHYFLIEKELDSFKPDIIHVTTPFSIGLCGLKYAKSKNVPIVSSYHTNFPQYLRYFKLEFLEQLIWNYFIWFHSQCRKNYCPSKDTLNTLRQKGIENLEIWSRGISSEAFSPQFRDLSFRMELGIHHKLVFLYVGRISPEKDIDILPDIIKELSSKYPSSVHFLFAGDGTYLDTMKGLSLPNTTFLGFVKGRELAKLYASSDIFLFPSSTETFGNVILEAMASGLPVIGCSEGGVSDNLICGYNGIACRPRNSDDFLAACNKLVADEDYAYELSKNALQHTSAIRWENIFGALVASYKEVLGETPVEDKKVSYPEIA